MPVSVCGCSLRAFLKVSCQGFLFCFLKYFSFFLSSAVLGLSCGMKDLQS